MGMSNEFEGGIDAYRDNLQAEWDRIAEDEARDALEDDYQYADHDFIVHGFYGVSNFGGYEVQLSESGDGARLRDSETLEVSDWVEIVYLPSEYDENELEPVIPMWGEVPLNMVMRVNR